MKIIFVMCILIVLVGCTQKFNPNIHVCEGVYWEYNTFLEGSGNKVVYQYSHECAESNSINCEYIKSSSYWDNGILYSCEIGKWK